MTGADPSDERHALLELDALLDRIEQLADRGSRDRFESDEGEVWRMTAMRPGALRTQVRDLLK
jgi:hypothetical protein